MRKCLLGLVIILAGCQQGPPPKDRALSQVNVLAEKLSQEVGEDGWFKKTTTEEVDPWGNKLEVKYKRNGGLEILTVWSNGPDGLPHTKDDISSVSYTLENAVVLAEIRKNRTGTDSLEAYSKALTKGLTKGLVQGWKDR